MVATTSRTPAIASAPDRKRSRTWSSVANVAASSSPLAAVSCVYPVRQSDGRAVAPAGRT